MASTIMEMVVRLTTISMTGKGGHHPAVWQEALEA